MSVAVAIALGAASMSDIAVLAQLAPVPGAAPGGSTARRGAGQTSAGFPRLVIAGKTLTGWVVIDMDATLVTAHPNSLYSPNYLYSPSRLTLPFASPAQPGQHTIVTSFQAHPSPNCLTFSHSYLFRYNWFSSR